MSEAGHEIRQEPACATVVVRPERRVSHCPDKKRDDEEPDDAGDREDHKLADQVPAAGRQLLFGQGGVGRCGFQSRGSLYAAAHNTAAMEKIRAAVIGVGYLGRFHAQKYAQAQACELVAVVDVRAVAREAALREFPCQVLEDYRELLGRVDVVSIVTPTPTHFAIAREFLAARAHVLVEKPVTETAAEAQQLIELARLHSRVLQVGHLERFNAAIRAAEPYLKAPRFIECHRLAPYRERGTDVNVVLDLMIHDIDIVQTIVGVPVAAVDAIGTAVFSDEIDIANARIRFENGCVANATASRVSMKTERKLRVFEDEAYLSIDLQQKILTVIKKRPGPLEAGQLPVIIDERSFEQGDALKEEIDSFLTCVRTGQEPVVNGAAGLRALETATRISEQMGLASARAKARAHPA
jgi:predicted dehydrogenase